MPEKLWTHSGDSHFIEPEDLWHSIMPRALADRMPKTTKLSDVEELVEVDGASFKRPTPKIALVRNAETGETIGEMSSRPPGTRDMKKRIVDLDNEGVWGEVVYASIGMWSALITDPKLVKAAAHAENEWMVSEIQGIAPDRMVPAGLMPMLDVADAVAEVHHCAEIGLHAISVPAGRPPGREDLNHPEWDPLWKACEETGMVVGVHIGSAGVDQSSQFRGRGGALMNYVESLRDGQYTAMKLVASGVFDRCPNLKVLVSESGATWLIYMADKLDEANRQHSMWVNPKLERSPSEYLFSNVYTSFQHDKSAPASYWAHGYKNAMFGSDYPHLEGTYGHTQETLQELFGGVEPAVSERQRIGAFSELFPHVSAPPAA
ncbi:MAG: amidohydrolase family protein [Acidimicrobiia bacterium]